MRGEGEGSRGYEETGYVSDGDNTPGWTDHSHHIYINNTHTYRHIVSRISEIMTGSYTIGV